MDKCWTIEEDRKRVLYKSSNTFLGLEPINEYISSLICDILGLTHAKYDIKVLTNLEKKVLVSTCPTFICGDTELISAANIINRDENYEKDFLNYVDILEKKGVKNAKEKIQKMFFLDYIMANSDRHLNNFGVIRDVNTLKWLDVAPIYDTGRSMMTSYPTIQSYDNNQIIFFDTKATRNDSIFIIKDLVLDKVTIEKLRKIPDKYEELLKKYKDYIYVKEDDFSNLILFCSVAKVNSSLKK